MPDYLDIEMRLTGADAVAAQIASISEMIAKMPTSINIAVNSTSNIAQSAVSSVSAVASVVTAAKSTANTQAAKDKAYWDKLKSPSSVDNTIYGMSAAKLAQAHKEYAALQGPSATSQSASSVSPQSVASGGGMGSSGNMASAVGALVRGGGSASSMISATSQLAVSFGALAGPVGIAVTAVIALGMAVNKAVEMVSSFSAARHVSGASYGEMGQGAGVGGVLGLSPGDVASMSRGLQQTLGSGGPGASMGMGYGLQDVGGGNPYTAKLDAMKNFLKAVDLIGSELPYDKAVQLARALGNGMDTFLQLRDMSPEMVGRVKDAMSEMYSPDMIRQAADFRGALYLAKIELQKGFFSAITALIDMGKTMIAPFVKIAEWVNGMMGNKNASVSKSLDSHKQALDDNTAALLSHMNGMRSIFGGGEMGAGAIPAGARGIAFNQRMGYETVRFGALG